MHKISSTVLNINYLTMTTCKTVTIDVSPISECHALQTPVKETVKVHRYGSLL